MRFLEKILILLVVLLSLTLSVIIFFPDAESYLENILKEAGKQIEPLQNDIQSIHFTDLIGEGEAVSENSTDDVGDSGAGYNFSAAQDIYYTMLNQTEQQLYAQFYANAFNLNQTFTVKEDVYPEELQTIFQTVYYDHPELFWLDNTYSYQYDMNSGKVISVTLGFNSTADDIDASKQAFDAAANAIISGAQNYQSDYEKEKYVHDALIQMTEYDLNADMNQSAYSLLVNHRTVCAGYARSFQYLMNQLGITTYYVVGTSEGQDHAWNIVMLDGNYYNVDVTWDDAAGDSDPYYFFNLADDEFNEYHTREGLSVNLPSCTDYTYSHLEDADYYPYYRFVPAQ